MIGLGTIINTAAIILGGIIGLVFKRWLKSNIQQTLTTAVGVCVIFVGIGGALEKMLTIENGALKTSGTMMMIISIALGAFIGELLKIEHGMEKFGEWLKRKTKSENDNSFVGGFVLASLTVCIGAMAIVGSLKDGISGDYSVLTAKAVLDFIIIMLLCASHGKGCVFSAIPVAIFQGLITLLAGFIQPIMTEKALCNISLVGSVLIFCVGLNLIRDKKIKVANLLPSIVFAIIWAFIF